MQFPELDYDFNYDITLLPGGITIAYNEEGTGAQTLLFIHGLASYMSAWSKLIPLLKNNFRCIAIDLPGYGKSAAGVHNGQVLFYAGVIDSFINKLALTNVTLIGHSMGGQISIAAALLFPGLIKNLILLAPAGFETFSAGDIKWIKNYNTPALYELAGEEQIESAFRSNFFKMPDDARKMIEERIKMRNWKNFKSYCAVVANSLNGLLDYPVEDQLGNLSLPVLIIFGRNDRWIPHPALHKELTPELVALNGNRKIKDSRLIMVDECGHFIPFEKPERCASEINSFLSR
jgi:pimeloyl-ACP methyl ester carboxylesterase